MLQNKKHPSVVPRLALLLAVLTALLAGCGPMEPTTVTFSSDPTQESSQPSSAPEPSQPESAPVDEVESSTAQPESTPAAEEKPPEVMMDMGPTVGKTYARIEKAVCYDSWEDAGIPEEELAYIHPMEEGGCILLLTVVFRNDGVTEEANEQMPFLTNGLDLITQESRDNGAERTIGAYYFDQHRDSDKEYFYYDAYPAIGEEATAVLGWQLLPMRLRACKTARCT